MSDRDIDVSILTSAESISYLAGVEIGVSSMPQYLIITRQGESAYVVREIEVSWQTRWEENTWCNNWVGVPDSASFVDEVVRQVRALSGSAKTLTLAAELERTSVSYAEISSWTAALGIDEAVSGTELVEGMRVIKTPAETDLMRRVCSMTATGMDAGVDSIKNGATELQAQREISTALENAGSGQLPGGPWAASGPDTYWGHMSARNVKPQSGDLITFMLSASQDRYVGPLERTFAVGKLAPEVQGVLTSVRAALNLALDKIQPGMTSHDADAIVRDFYSRRDLDKYFINRLAYAIGMAYPSVWWENEIMQLRPNDKRTVEPGMTFHLVPSLHIPGIGFIQSSMPVVITESGCSPLSDYPIDVPAISVA
jgi:Xaa-Pro dipeptidase